MQGYFQESNNNYELTEYGLFEHIKSLAYIFDWANIYFWDNDTKMIFLFLNTYKKDRYNYRDDIRTEFVLNVNDKQDYINYKRLKFIIECIYKKRRPQIKSLVFGSTKLARAGIRISAPEN